VLSSLVTLTFDLLTSTWGHGSHGTSFLPYFEIALPSILNLGSGTGQTDDGRQCITPHPMRAGHNNGSNVKFLHAAYLS